MANIFTRDRTLQIRGASLNVAPLHWGTSRNIQQLKTKPHLLIPKVFLLTKKGKEVNNCSNQTQLLYRGYQFWNQGVSANHKTKASWCNPARDLHTALRTPYLSLPHLSPSPELRPVPATGARGARPPGTAGEPGRGSAHGGGAAASGGERTQSRAHLERSHPVPFLEIDHL